MTIDSSIFNGLAWARLGGHVITCTPQSSAEKRGVERRGREGKTREMKCRCSSQGTPAISITRLSAISASHHSGAEPARCFQSSVSYTRMSQQDVPLVAGGSVHHQPFVACAVIRTNTYVLVVHEWCRYAFRVRDSRFRQTAIRSLRAARYLRTPR
jgi:hypothetical protein